MQQEFNRFVADLSTEDIVFLLYKDYLKKPKTQS